MFVVLFIYPNRNLHSTRQNAGYPINIHRMIKTFKSRLAYSWSCFFLLGFFLLVNIRGVFFKQFSWWSISVHFYSYETIRIPQIYLNSIVNQNSVIFLIKCWMWDHMESWTLYGEWNVQYVYIINFSRTTLFSLSARNMYIAV